MIALRDPREIWKIFSAAYRTIEPTVPITPEMDRFLDRFIEDIYEGRAISLDNMPSIDLEASEDGLPRCSRHFLKFIDSIKWAMEEECVCDVPHRRAVNLLYNNDAYDEDWTQPFLAMRKFKGVITLFSTSQLHQTFGLAVERPLPDCCPADFPQIYDPAWQQPCPISSPNPEGFQS